MAADIEIYTGYLVYKNIDFSFVFDKKELRLIIPSDKQDEVEHWLMEEIGNGTYSLGHPVRVQEPFLTGECNETRQRIVFILSQGSYIYTKTLF